jgi:hypothetical protein
MLGGVTMGGFYTEIEVRAGSPISDEAFGALADELYALDSACPDVTDADLLVSGTEGIARFTMTVTADGPAEAGVRALTTVRTVIHAAGGHTPGWEGWEARSALRSAPAEESDRLYADA